MLNDQRNRVAEVRQALYTRFPLAVCAWHFRAIRDVPGAVLLDDSRELIVHYVYCSVRPRRHQIRGPVFDQESTRTTTSSDLRKQDRWIMAVEGSSMCIAPGIVLPEAEIAVICARYEVQELALFGSAARGEMRPDSDVDLLVEFKTAARPGLLGLAAMSRELSTLLGRRVDLAVKPALKPRIRPHVLAEAHVIYAA